MLNVLTTILSLLFGLGCFLGFYVLFGIIMGDREKWKFIFLISLVVLFFVIAAIAPKDYEFPFAKGKPSNEDIEKGYKPPPGDQYEPLP